MKRILVTAIGSFSADAVINNLKKAECYVVGCDIYSQELIANVLDVDFFYQAPLATNEEGYLEFIYEICEREKIDYIIPLTDVEVDILNANRDFFMDKKIVICISDEATVKVCRNKYLLYQFLKNCKNVQLIPTILLEKADHGKIQFPIVMKPYDGRSSQGLRYISDVKELELFAKNNDVSKYIMQPKIEGEVVTVDVIRESEKNIMVAVCRKELLRTSNGAGLSVHVFHDEALEGKAKEIAVCLNIKGCVNFEFIETDAGEYYFLECNPRFSGGVKFSCMAGYDFIANHLKCFEQNEIEQKCEIQEMYIARKYKEFITKTIS